MTIPENAVEGRRVYADEGGSLRLAEGDYGFSPNAGCWQVRPPGCHAGSIPKHTVVEHEDNTISVTPSIVLMDGERNWHGFLEKGYWREV